MAHEVKYCCNIKMVIDGMVSVSPRHVHLKHIEDVTEIDFKRRRGKKEGK